MKNNSPLISIVIPAHKAAGYIEETLHSILRQDEESWEVLIFEDGVFDDTAAKVSQFRALAAPRPVHLIESAAQVGVSCARNTLLDAASGEYIAFLDADDTWNSDHLAYSLATLKAGDADWIVGGMNLINESGDIFETNILPAPTDPKNIPTLLLQYNYVLPSGFVGRRKLFEDGLRFDSSLSIGEDLDLWIRLIESGARMTISDRATLNYRKHDSSTTKDPVKFEEGMSQLYEKYLSNPVVDAETCLACFRHSLWVAARMTWRREPHRALDALRRLVEIKHFDVKGWAFLTLVSIRLVIPRLFCSGVSNVSSPRILPLSFL